jgi:hypothetical protein
MTPEEEQILQELQEQQVQQDWDNSRADLDQMEHSEQDFSAPTELELELEQVWDETPEATDPEPTPERSEPLGEAALPVWIEIREDLGPQEINLPPETASPTVIKETPTPEHTAASHSSKEPAQKPLDLNREPEKRSWATSIGTALTPIGYAIKHRTKWKHPVAFAVGEVLGKGVMSAALNLKRPLDRAIIEKAVTELVKAVGKDGRYSGETFDYDVNKGVKIALKDGTLAYANGKINPKLTAQQQQKIIELPQNVEGVKSRLEIDQAITEIVGKLGKDGRYSGKTFDYDINNGVKLVLKDGTPAYVNGEVNPYLTPEHAQKIYELPTQVSKVMQELEPNITKQQQPVKTQEITA